MGICLPIKAIQNFNLYFHSCSIDQITINILLYIDFSISFFQCFMYNKDVVCVIDKGQEPICVALPRQNRRSATAGITNNALSYDPYIPRANSIFYNCSSLECERIILHSMTQITNPNLKLKECYLQLNDYQCETIRYNYLKNIDKLLLLSNNVRNKTFYMVDCLVYTDRGRVCHKKDDVDSHTKLVDTGTIVRPNESNILSQDDFICEENDIEVNCDLNPYVPYKDGLVLKESLKIHRDILLKTESRVVVLQRNCFDSWCGFSGRLIQTRRDFTRYNPPGGKVYRCYYANKQQICKELYSKYKSIYNERGWLSSR
ncbi:hypothetical protein K1T71_004518 [Dendrolimus kikuchii]|uniref:Uncharacterized protein n=1 Tax=Dendrolimus kikuchii TaxID=765133 RepID=A0ACC1D7T5_9NEOP|nr:hypothetical protein K1T71_004518 [Dendrolimus kikuchii]